MISRENPTILRLWGMGVPLYSARGITQTLEPIDSSVQVKRTVNGALRDLSEAQFRKFKSSITCSDQDPPATDGRWPGTIVTVECIVELSYLTIGGMPERTPVDYSMRTSGDHTFYRPELEMMVSGAPTISKDEYGATVSWTIQLEEV